MFTFIAALFITVERWKQPKYPSTCEGENKKWYILEWNITWTGILFSLKKKILTNSNTCYDLDEP